MPRGPMSADAKAKIAAAQRKRWAAHRAAKAAGMAPAGKKKRGRPVGSTNKRRGAPAMAKTVMSLNPFMNVSVKDLVAARKHIHEAWNATLAMLGMGGGSAKGKARRGRPRKK